MRRVALLVLAFALAGCGGEREHGAATLWVTQGRGAHVLYTGTVPAGLTAMQALAREQKVTTRYGGRFVESIDGVQGSLGKERDWFFFVNGLESGRGAADVRLHPGDVEWWDYRSWANGGMSVPVVAGAYPRPFLDAPTAVESNGVAVAVARAIARQVHGSLTLMPRIRDVIVLDASLPPSSVRIDKEAHGVQLELGAGIAARLARDPRALRFRFGTPS